MIKVVLRGGLGNQMFQYALGMMLAEKNNSSLVLDTTFLNDRFPRKEITFREFDLGIFTLEPHFTALSKVSAKFPIPGLWVGLDLFCAGVEYVLGIQKIVLERTSHAFDPNIQTLKGNIMLNGFWQTEKYFSDHGEKIKSAFRFRFPLEGEAKTIANEIISSNSVSLHVRRGDYIAFKSVQATMGDVGMAYYKEGVKYIVEKVKNPHFFIFSNDIEWCKENIKLDFPTTYVTDSSAGPRSSYHLQLMSLCKNNIIANSTFSWWAAWLNNNAQKIVVAPERWSVGGKNTKNDIIPEGWVTIS